MDSNLISIINDLQDAFGSCQDTFSLDLPQIAVVGSQSAGKSSVLENVVGKDFLPRGAGIVTRRPLYLQLIQDRATSVEYGEFLHLPGRKFTDFQEIRKEIQAETDRLTGSNKGISAVPISLRIYSPWVLDLTLVDLPGIAKIPVGDQPQDIEAQIRAMVQSYIEKPNCLILAVTPANTDLATSDALQMALEFDPEGVRTIGVLTKLDLVDDGLDCREILNNNVFSLRYGYVGVVNRSQRDIEGRKDIGAAIESEKLFFSGHPSYRDMGDRTGTEVLRKHLSQHLTRHIAETIPDLKLKLTRRLGRLESELSEFRTEFYYEDSHWKEKALILLAINFAQHFRSELVGNEDAHLNLNSLSTGARIMYLFHRDYPQSLLSTEFTQEDKMKHEIGFAIQNILGVRTGLFTPDKAFDVIVREQILRLKEPTLALLDKVEEEMECSITLAAEELRAFPALAAEMRNRGQRVISHFADKARAQVEQLVAFEHAYINTKHEDFVGFSYAEQKAYSRVLKRRNPGNAQKIAGWLFLSGGFGKTRQKHWFVLTLDTLSWFTDETLTERIYSIPMDENLQFRDPLRDNRLVLFDKTQANVYRDKSTLDLQAPSFEELESWKRNLIQVGVFAADGNILLTDQPASVSHNILNTNDPWLERQIESLWILIDSYMRIVCKTLLDIVPKCIVKVLIKDSVSHVEKNLISELSRIETIEDLMEVDGAALERKRTLQRSVESCRLALERIRSIRLPEVKRRTIYVKPTLLHKSESQPSLNKPDLPPRPVPPPKKTSLDSKRVNPSRKSSRDLKKALETINSGSKSQFF